MKIKAFRHRGKWLVFQEPQTISFVLKNWGLGLYPYLKKNKDGYLVQKRSWR